MGKYIINLDGYYLEWSTIVDAPTTWGMSLAAFQDYYLSEYGQSGFDKLEARLARVSKTGVSAYSWDSVADLISYNRAGFEEAQLSREEIFYWYCVRKANPEPAPALEDK